MFGVECRFECDSPVLVNTPGVASNLYRIAQEAVSNAIKHGRARSIVISLDASDAGLRLAVADDGNGIPDPLPEPKGMGLRIMADRARVIGARFDTGSSPTGGTMIVCSVPH
jgi:signal transduction histidine kinase